MTHRELPESEWGKLAGTDLGALPAFPPGFRVFVVEHLGQIVGHWGFFPAVHCEGVWVHPEHRKGGSVARHLLAAMRPVIEAAGLGGAWTGAETPEVATMLEKLHARPVAMTPYFWPCDSGKARILSGE